MKILSRLHISVQDTVYTTAGILIAAFAMKSFMLPNQFLDGGVTGVSLLLHEIYHWPLNLVLPLVSIPFVVAGAYQINRRFAIKTAIAIVGLSLAMEFIPFPPITSDKLLVSLFGGFFLGVGVGLSMRGGTALDGMEILALYTLKRSSFTISEIILGFNAIIFAVAALKLGLPTAMYAMLTYFVATRTINYVIEGLEEYTGVTIISGRSEEIKQALVMKLGRGITVYKGERGFMKDSFEVSQPTDIVFTVITRLEVRRLRNVVHDIDSKAFVFTNTIKEAAGGVLKRRAEH